MAEKPPEDAAPAIDLMDELQRVGVAVQQATAATDHTASMLRAQLEEIARLSKSIRSLAQQTNLLGLNATLEAARAGEAGRGFKVVSQEVKALAQRATIAASEIDERLTEAIASADANSSAVDDLTRAVGEGLVIVGKVTGAA